MRHLRLLPLLALLVATIARAEPIATGTFLYSLEPGPSDTYSLSGSLTFDAASFEAFDASINLGTAPGVMDVHYSGTQGPTGFLTSPISFQTGSSDPGFFKFIASGATSCQPLFCDGLFGLALMNVSGSALDLLPSNLSYSLDGAPSCFLSYPTLTCGGPFALNAYRPGLTPRSEPNCTGLACRVTVALKTTRLSPNVVMATPLEAKVTYAGVSVAGETLLKGLPVLNPLLYPGDDGNFVGYTLTLFDLSTTAAVNAPITACTSYADDDGDGVVDGTLLEAKDIRLFHRADAEGPWIDSTVLPVDTASRMVCATVGSLSRFALAGVFPRTTTTTMTATSSTTLVTTNTTTSSTTLETTNTPTTTSTTLEGTGTTSTTQPCRTARCLLDASRHGVECTDQDLPSAVLKKLDSALRSLDRAAAARDRKARMLRARASRGLRAAGVRAVKAAGRKNPKLSGACAAAIRRATDSARAQLRNTVH
jgi:hypothetical protein